MHPAFKELRDPIPLKIYQNECNTDDDQGDEIPAVIDGEQFCHLEEVNIDATKFIYRFKQDGFGRLLEITPVTSPETTQEGVTVDKPRKKNP